MSYILDTILNDYQDKVIQDEIRIPKYGLINLFKKETARIPYMSPELQNKIATHEGISIKIPQLTEDVITTSTVESFTIPTNESTSAMETLSFVTIFAGFKMFPETFVNNLISKPAYMLNKIKEVDKAMAKKLETYMDTHLNTYKTAVWSGASQYGYNFNTTSDTLEVTDAQQKDRMFDLIKAMAFDNNWSEDELSLASSSAIEVALAEYRKYKGGNDKDLTQDIPEIFKSNRVTLTSGKRFTAYLCEPGAVGVLPNYKQPFIEGKQIGTAKWDISDMEMPQLGSKVMTFCDEQKADASLVGGAVNPQAIMSYSEDYGFVYRFCLLKRYNSDSTTRPSYILKIDGAKS